MRQPVSQPAVLSPLRRKRRRVVVGGQGTTGRWDGMDWDVRVDEWARAKDGRGVWARREMTWAVIKTRACRDWAGLARGWDREETAHALRQRPPIPSGPIEGFAEGGRIKRGKRTKTARTYHSDHEAGRSLGIVGARKTGSSAALSLDRPRDEKCQSGWWMSSLT